MPLRHRDEAFIPEARGVTFVMSEVGARDVVCVVEVQALQAAARECGLATQDSSAIFLGLRKAIEECASDLYDREATATDADRVVVVHAADLLA